MAYIGRVYPACALTGAPSEWLRFVADPDSLVKRALEEAGIEVLNFIGTEKGTIEDVYHGDFEECLPSADLVLAFADISSHGTGMEIADNLRRYFQRTAVFVKSGTKRLTRAITGSISCNPDRLTYHEYDPSRPDDIARTVVGLLEKMKKDGEPVSEASDEICAHMLPVLLYPNVYNVLCGKGKKVNVYDHRRRLLRTLPPRAWTSEEVDGAERAREKFLVFGSAIVSSFLPQEKPEPVAIQSHAINGGRLV